ncbi:DUF6817 domain-containing protein [Actinomadura sp. 7K534]|uniref:DUF6817 domain-containing protein n=1 Tax=Actinomadura sp. 7K534 TaxID=2530366 RepID=UPI001051F8DC|nr:hypothetical protein [Actinomadura sp. 7K534]TDB93715.1 hypothetical protein E1266_19300 [Actinomadura sp. 7K534]
MPTDSAAGLLLARGADRLEHPGGTLYAHLRRVHATLGEWGARPELRLAGLCHAFYGTDGFAEALGDPDRRGELIDVIGAEAEALVYLYASCDRSRTYPHLASADGPFTDRFTGAVHRPSQERRRDFAELTVANELDVLAASPDLRVAHGEALTALFATWRPLLSTAAGRAVQAFAKTWAGRPAAGR